ncbi:hypothetical protein LTR56_026753 [Elasticomyces elasticus]|nr:hypothetical protein LTR22_027768 [Elasticomyces elasticus]KAK3615192.1 hypothetical protein LTR56_026753 [Elasticomyces elasticus]KAK4900189.1 hypothetical protein LTR49_027495 [Elasticomyces elasticus]KAK5736597.1 hypothetical protein LTS12_026133 [Elasticomyces elasticus]
MESAFLDTPAALANFLSNLGDCDGHSPRFYVDLEGNNLSRKVAGRDGRTLQEILESRSMIKIFFDIRNDSDALFSLHGINVAVIEDLHLMELASRNFAKRNINGLAKCIERDNTVSFEEKRTWRAVKDKGKSLFDPHQGGTYAVFDRRPLSSEVMEYCTQDVTLMPHLRDIYRGKLCGAWWKRIEAETNAHILLS